jgi:hypothetical protein
MKRRKEEKEGKSEAFHFSHFILLFSHPPQRGGSPKKRSFSLFWEIPLLGGSFYPSLHFILLFPHSPFGGFPRKSLVNPSEAGILLGVLSKLFYFLFTFLGNPPKRIPASLGFTRMGKKKEGSPP